MYRKPSGINKRSPLHKGSRSPIAPAVNTKPGRPGVKKREKGIHSSQRRAMERQRLKQAEQLALDTEAAEDIDIHTIETEKHFLNESRTQDQQFARRVGLAA